MFDPQGDLYGATTDGGPATCKPIGGACGTVFQLSPPSEGGGSWTETLIYQFQGKGSNDASVPSGGLIRDSAGNLYGVTGYGGTGDCVLLGVTAGCGTVYELSPPQQKGDAWTETILYSFPTAKQGYVPNGDLVFDSAGNLYGATSFGGGKGTTCDEFYGGQCGVVFELTPPELSPPKTKGGKWTEKVLHAFAGGTDGANPNGGLVFDNKGAVYGTTSFGGFEGGACSAGGCGIVFELKPTTKKRGAWAEEIVHRFKGAPDGGGPSAGLVFDTKGNLYGTTLGGGGVRSGSGTVFKLTHNANGAWAERILYTFQFGDDGAEPRGGVVFDTRGNVYGTASAGGASGGWTVFELRHRRAGVGRLLCSTPLRATPMAPGRLADLIFDAASNLYGTTEQSGTGQACGNYGCGTVFELSP